MATWLVIMTSGYSYHVPKYTCYVIMINDANLAEVGCQHIRTTTAITFSVEVHNHSHMLKQLGQNNAPQ